MDSKSPVVKSKSNLTPKSSKRNKKSVSNEDIKKREVYVERKAVSTLLDAKEAMNTLKRKAPPRPRPGQKKFLSSVLTILSKSTASTQYPDVNDETKRKIRFKPRRYRNDKSDANNNKKYKSRVLNKNIRTSEDVVVIQSKKDIAQTSSNYSETVNVKWSDVEATKEKTVYDEVLEGKKFINEPETSAETNKKEDKIYDLFVDLLETTFNMYNVKECDVNDSNTVLQINEDVAKKLELNNEFININKKVKIKLDHLHLDNKVSDDTPKGNTKSKFAYGRKRQRLPKSGKENLLNILKEELKMSATLEEPQNIYEALRVIAKNKQRSETVHRPLKNENGRRDPECMFRRRNLFLESKRRNKREAAPKYQYLDVPKKDRTVRILRNIPSYKSVEVYGYNYEEPPQEVRQKKQVLLTYHSSQSASDLDYYSLLKFPVTSTSTFNFN